jgi:hypothetical protein
MTTQTQNKLSPNTVWLFAFGSIAAGIGTSYALSGLGQKVTAAVYFALVLAGGFASTYLSTAKLRGAVLAFIVGAAAAGAGYYFLVSSIMSQATTIVADASSNGAAHAEAVKAGASMGKTFGIFIAAIVFLETIIGGIAGAFAGAKARGQGGLAALGALAKATR